MQKEIWKPILGYEDYQVSNLGNIKSFKRHKEQILVPTKTFGYSYICLCKSGNIKRIRVHKLVAEAFIPNPKNYPCINHKNENKSDNSIGNLEWCTYKYNNKYGTKPNRIASTLSIPIAQYDKNGNFIKKWESAKIAGESLKLSCSHIRDCCRGKRKSHGGFIWKNIS